MKQYNTFYQYILIVRSDLIQLVMIVYLVRSMWFVFQSFGPWTRWNDLFLHSLLFILSFRFVDVS